MQPTVLYHSLCACTYVRNKKNYSLQATIDCNIFPTLIEVLNSDAEYKTRKEAAWAVLNATSGGTHEQIRQVVVKRGHTMIVCSLLWDWKSSQA